MQSIVCWNATGALIKPKSNLRHWRRPELVENEVLERDFSCEGNWWKPEAVSKLEKYCLQCKASNMKSKRGSLYVDCNVALLRRRYSTEIRISPFNLEESKTENDQSELLFSMRPLSNMCCACSSIWIWARGWRLKAVHRIGIAEPASTWLEYIFRMGVGAVASVAKISAWERRVSRLEFLSFADNLSILLQISLVPVRAAELVHLK